MQASNVDAESPEVRQEDLLAAPSALTSAGGLVTITPVSTRIPLMAERVLAGLQSASAREPSKAAIASESCAGLTFGVLELRSNRLARGLLARSRVAPRSVALLCCENHTADLAVGMIAAYKCGAHPVVVSIDRLDFDQVRQELATLASDVVLLCEDVQEMIGELHGRFLVVGNGPGAIWWKSLEARYSPEPLQQETNRHLRADGIVVGSLVAVRRAGASEGRATLDDIACVVPVQITEGRSVLLKAIALGSTLNLVEQERQKVQNLVSDGAVVLMRPADLGPLAGLETGSCWRRSVVFNADLPTMNESCGTADRHAWSKGKKGRATSD
jgi:hypothetical protein